jgi:hypothetical protein
MNKKSVRKNTFFMVKRITENEPAGANKKNQG